MTGQSCHCSLHCFASTCHYSITSCFLTFLYNKSQCLLMSFFISVCPDSFCSAELLFLFMLCCCVHIVAVLPSLFLVDSVFCFLFPFPRFSSSFFPQVSSTLYNQSAGTSSLCPYIPKPLGPFCHPSFHRFPPPSFLPTVLCLPNASLPFP